jgi:NDP-sugar pyrophosphorylase family protein
METIRKAMILAGGKATRLQELTRHRPKPMVEVGGRPLVEHTIRQLAAAGVREAGMNLYQSPEAVMRHFGDGARFGLSLRYSIETEPLGTAGALRPFRDFFADGPFFLVYGDNLTTCDFGALARAHRKHHGVATVALFWRDDVTKHSAVEIDGENRIRRFIEKPKSEEAPSQWISAGMMVLEPRIFDYISPDGMFDVGFHLFPALLAAGELMYGYYMQEHEGLWWIDTPEDYARVTAVWKDGFSA